MERLEKWKLVSSEILEAIVTRVSGAEPAGGQTTSARLWCLIRCF